MYGLSLGVSKISNTLPLPVYGLLSGLNSATVGAIAFAAVQLSNRTVTDQFSRIVLVFGACAGLCYSAIWYFPTLVFICGITTMIWDMWVQGATTKMLDKWRKRTSRRHTHGDAAL